MIVTIINLFMLCYAMLNTVCRVWDATRSGIGKKIKNKSKQGYRAIQKTGKHEHGIRKRPNIGYECNANQTPRQKKKQTNGYQNHNPTERKKKNESQVAVITPSNTIRPKTGGKRVKPKKKKKKRKGGISLTGNFFLLFLVLRIG